MIIEWSREPEISLKGMFSGDNNDDDVDEVFGKYKDARPSI